MSDKEDPRVGDGIYPNCDYGYVAPDPTIPLPVMSMLEQVMGCPTPTSRRSRYSLAVLLAVGIVLLSLVVVH